MVKQQRKEEIDFSSSLAEVWRVLNENERDILRKHSTIRTFKRNGLIYYQGDEPKDMMCLLKGKVKIYKDGIGGRTQIIRMIKPIQYFGYRAFFAHENYLTNASAFEPSTICMIPLNIVTDLIYGNPNLAMFFIRQLSTDLGISDERTINLTQKHIRGRLAARRLGQPLEYDDLERNPYPHHLCQRARHCHGWKENPHHQRGTAQANQSVGINYK